MIDRKFTPIVLPDEKYEFNPFYNPYISKLALKILPKTDLSRAKFIHFYSPFHKAHKISISQGLPIYKDSRLRIALNWQQTLRNNFVRCSFGGSL